MEKYLRKKMGPNNIDVRYKTLHGIIARAAEFLCKENQHGSWGDTRTNAACIWAISNCGLAKSHKKFVRYTIGNLLEGNTMDEDGMCWNYEIWDTSVSAIAIKNGSGTDFSRCLSKIQEWLLTEYSETEKNFRNEPWETLWAIGALLYLGRLKQNSKQLIKDSIFWLLGMRNSEGALISPHYVGLLLTVMTFAYKNIGLSQKEKFVYDEAIRQSISYLLNQYKKKKKENALWNDEPWSIGLILHGLAVSYKWSPQIFQDDNFNEYLINWCNKRWDMSLGWTDVVDTSNLLIGLSEYYINREMMLRNFDETKRAKIQKKISDNVNFEFREIGVKPMTVYPIWKERKFRLKKRTSCILMPFKQPWSEKIRQVLKDVLKRCGFEAFRPDDLYDREVLEGIWKAINEAEIIIADCSGGNLNVFYELGIAQTIGKEVILICQNIEKDIPFDLRSQRVIQYDKRNPKEILGEKLPELIDYIKEGKM